MNELNQAISRVLIDGLSPGLRAAVDRLYARGASKAGILSAVEAMAAKAAGGDPTKGGLTVDAVRAYLESLS